MAGLDNVGESSTTPSALLSLCNLRILNLSTAVVPSVVDDVVDGGRGSDGIVAAVDEDMFFFIVEEEEDIDEV